MAFSQKQINEMIRNGFLMIRTDFSPKTLYEQWYGVKAKIIRRLPGLAPLGFNNRIEYIINGIKEISWLIAIPDH
jgi:hypothetical protein